VPARQLPVFRARDELARASDLTAAIQAAPEGSGALLSEAGRTDEGRRVAEQALQVLVPPGRLPAQGDAGSLRPFPRAAHLRG